MASRDIDDLQTDVAEKARRLLQRCSEEDLDLLIYCTLRSMEEQARLYRQGRPLRQIEAKAGELRERWHRPDLADLLIAVGPQNGGRVTNAGPGQSMHNYGLAFDSVPLRAGKPVWSARRPEDRALWDRYGGLAEEVGLEWAGRWTRFREFPHVQRPGAAWRELIRQR